MFLETKIFYKNMYTNYSFIKKLKFKVSAEDIISRLRWFIQYGKTKTSRNMCVFKYEFMNSHQLTRKSETSLHAGVALSLLGIYRSSNFDLSQSYQIIITPWSTIQEHSKQIGTVNNRYSGPDILSEQRKVQAVTCCHKNGKTFKSNN